MRAAVLQYMDFSAGNTDARVQPNIMVVLAESTFDPGATFRLEGHWNDALFRAGEFTAANGLLRVNAMGGGTWITEFETIVGLDSSMFGYSGMYTHASLSPFVDHSIATYLRERGYHTSAFFRTAAISTTAVVRTPTTASKRFSTATTWVAVTG